MNQVFPEATLHLKRIIRNIGLLREWRSHADAAQRQTALSHQKILEIVALRLDVTSCNKYAVQEREIYFSLDKSLCSLTALLSTLDSEYNNEDQIRLLGIAPAVIQEVESATNLLLELRSEMASFQANLPNLTSRDRVDWFRNFQPVRKLHNMSRLLYEIYSHQLAQFTTYYQYTQLT